MSNRQIQVRLLIGALFVMALSGLSPTTARGLQACPAKHSRGEVALPMGAFAMIEVPGTCKLLATLGGDEEQATGGVALIDLGGRKPRLERVVRTPTAAVGLTLTKDHRLAVIAGSDRIYVLDVAAIIAGKESVAGTIRYATDPGTVSVALTPNEKLLFASDESAGKITVLSFDEMRRSRFAVPRVISSIEVDYAPTVLTISPDGRWVYVPVQGIRRRYNPPIVCRSEGGTDPTPINPVGGILAIDVAKAVSRPGEAVVSRAHAGCSPVRFALSRSGKTLWITNRLGDTVRALDTAKIIRDPERSEQAVVKVGHQPIGVALLRGDGIVAVANASRWDPDQTSPKTVSAFSAASAFKDRPVRPASIRVGRFPRDLSASVDGETLYVSNFGSKSIGIIPVRLLSIR
jgi:DNA-binding beta-propeller fold protein YncE